MTKEPLVYDIHVEEYHVERVMRQFYRYQSSPLTVARTVEAHAHRYTMNSSIV